MILVNVEIQRLTPHPRIIKREKITAWGIEVTFGKGTRTCYEELPLTLARLLHTVVWMGGWSKCHTIRLEPEEPVSIALMEG